MSQQWLFVYYCTAVWDCLATVDSVDTVGASAAMYNSVQQVMATVYNRAWLLCHHVTTDVVRLLCSVLAGTCASVVCASSMQLPRRVCSAGTAPYDQTNRDYNHVTARSVSHGPLLASSMQLPQRVCSAGTAPYDQTNRGKAC